MSFISMIGMEIAMNTSDFIITRGKAAFDDPMYRMALVVALVAGFIAPLPYNYYKLKIIQPGMPLAYCTLAIVKQDLLITTFVLVAQENP